MTWTRNSTVKWSDLENDNQISISMGLLSTIEAKSLLRKIERSKSRLIGLTVKTDSLRVVKLEGEAAVMHETDPTSADLSQAARREVILSRANLSAAHATPEQLAKVKSPKSE